MFQKEILSEEHQTLKDKLKAGGKTFFAHHDCACCGELVGYRVYWGSDLVAYDSHCGCGGWSEPRPVTWSEFLRFVEERKMV